MHTREGAAELLGVDGAPMTETDSLVEEASKASRPAFRSLSQRIFMDFP